MSLFVLQPCKFRENHFAPIKHSVTWQGDFKALLAKFADVSNETISNLKLIRVGGFIGKCKAYHQPSKINTFFVVNENKSNYFAWIFKKDPSFASRLLEVYRIDELLWDGFVSEKEKQS